MIGLYYIFIFCHENYVKKPFVLTKHSKDTFCLREFDIVGKHPVLSHKLKEAKENSVVRTFFL